MKQWLISKIPTWLLHYWVWRNRRLVCSGHPRYAFCIEADIELFRRYDHWFDWGCDCDPTVGENCEACGPEGDRND